LYGLDTVTVLQDGTVTLDRMRDEQDSETNRLFRETATLKLPDEALAQVLDAVEENHLLQLGREYHAGVYDGTQWVLWVKQGGKEKLAYFDNRFPEGVVRFAAALDQTLAANGSEKAEWRRVDDAQGRKHERELWDSLRR
jgi:hypothetical protein